MTINDFFAQHAVFTVKEFDNYLSQQGSDNINTRKATLSYYQKQGRVLPIRRGLYAVIPPGESSQSYQADPYLIAAKMTEDSVLGYHTALEFYGKAYSHFTELSFVSTRKTLPLKYGTYEIRCVPTPRVLRKNRQEMFGVNQHERNGVVIRSTNYERTFVDVLDRPELTGSWEEIWRSLESIEFLNLEMVIQYVTLLSNATTAAKVGFFLEQHKEDLMVEDSHLTPLRALCPNQPHYLIRSARQDCRWVKNWNLMVPYYILGKNWEETP